MSLPIKLDHNRVFFILLLRHYNVSITLKCIKIKFYIKPFIFKKNIVKVHLLKELIYVSIRWSINIKILANN